MTTAIVYAILFSLLAVIAIAPLKARYLALFCGIVLFPLGISFLQSPTIRPQDLFLYGFLAIACIKDRDHFLDDIKAFPLKVPLILILFCHYISIYANEGFSTKQFYAGTREFIELYGYLFTAFIISRHTSLDGILRSLYKITVVICIFGILEILLEGNYPYTYICRAFPIYTGYYSLDSIISCIQEYRIRAMLTTAHPTAFGMLLCCLFLLFLSLRNNPQWEKGKLNILYGLLIVNLFLSGSRTGMACAAIGAFFLILHKRSIILKIACIGLCFFLATAYVNAIVDEFSQQSKGSSLTLRQQQLLFTFFQIQQNPILGNGVGATKNVFDYDDDGRPINDASIGGLESIVFRTLIDYGFVGLFAYYLYDVCLFILFFRRRKESWVAIIGYNLVFTSTLFFTLSGHIGNNTAFAFLLEGLLLGNLYKEDGSEEIETEEPEQIEVEPE